MKIRVTASALLATLVLFSPLTYAASPLIGVTGDGGSTSETLFTINTGNASATLLTPLGNGDDGEVIIFNPADGLIYHFSGRNDLDEIDDPDAGSIYETVLPSSPFTVTSLHFDGLLKEEPNFAEEALAGAYNITTGEFLVADLDGFLYSVSTTGRVKFIGDLGFQTKGLAFKGSTLYALEQFDSFESDGELQLVVIDPATGATLSSVTVTLEGMDLNGRSNGLAVDPATGALIAVVQGTDGRILVAIDPATGTATSIGVLEDGFAAITFLGFYGIADLFAASIIGAASAPLDSGDFLTHLPLHGAHHRPLLLQRELDGEHCIWASGDVAGYHENDAIAALAEIGVCHDFVSERLRVGIGAGKSFLDQDLDLNGNSETDGAYLIGEMNYRFGDTSFIGTLNVFYGSWDAEVNRHYVNFNRIEESRGKTDVDAWAGRVRLDWHKGFSFESAAFTPHAEFTFAGIDVEGYAESGGTFPVTIEGRDQTTTELRGGIDMELPMNDAFTLVGTVEGVHRFEGDDPNIRGTIIGQDFEFEGNDDDDTWVRFGLGVEYLPARNVLVTANINGSTDGEDPQVSGGVGIRVGF